MSLKHLENLIEVIPDLKNRFILDIGSGKGGLLISAAKEGFDIKGIEICKEYIDESLEKAEKEGVVIDVRQSFGEDIPFNDNYFDFLNLSEVIEHVNDPDKLLEEMYRILKKDGKVYISVPSRFSVLDTHYKIYFINWMPRFVAQKILIFLGKNKPKILENGKQNLDDMYYDTFKGFSEKANEYGFIVSDLRLLKLRKKYKNSLKYYFIKPVYMFLRPFYFKAFHFLLLKK